jgi:hypothetical protein
MSKINTVFIINNCYVRWESFYSISYLQDIFECLYKKYNTGPCIIEINKKYYCRKYHNNFFLCELLDNKDYAEIKVITKNKNVYKLSKDIN